MASQVGARALVILHGAVVGKQPFISSSSHQNISIYWMGSDLIPAISVMAIFSSELEREEETNQV